MKDEDKQAMDKVEEFAKRHNFWITGRLNEAEVRTMVRVAIEDGDAEIARLSQQVRTAKEALEALPELVPTNWLDPLLTGSDAVIDNGIEALLIGIQNRLQERAQTALAAMEAQDGR